MRALFRHGTAQSAAILATILGMVVWAPGTTAADAERGRKWQFSFPVTFTSGSTVDGLDGTRTEVNDDLGWGLGFGYHFNEHFLLGADVTWINANFDSNVATDLNGDQVPDELLSVSGSFDATTLNLYGQYNFLKSSVTPFVRVGLGWSWIDSNIPAGPVEGVCWWHPYYGYICDSWQPTYGATEFSYGGAVGVRADVMNKFVVEASYNVLWVDFARSNTGQFDGFRLNLGWTF
jgi:opacity protein-like surface antigen